MKRMFVVRLAPLLVIGALATVPAVARAGAPEFGRCLLLTGDQAGHGGYGNASCTSASPGKTGRFEWYPGAAKANFTTKSKEGRKIVFEGVNNVQVTCTGETSTAKRSDAGGPNVQVGPDERLVAVAVQRGTMRPCLRASASTLLTRDSATLELAAS